MFFTSGLWSRGCIKEARKYVKPENLIEVTNLDKVGGAELTDPSKWNIDEEASFFHICTNETVDGLEFTNENFPWHLIPKGVPVVADMSSHIGTFKIDWNRI
jgi:phosphoserine aminotransferase